MKNIFYDKSKIDYGNLLFPRRALWMLLIPLIIEQMLNSLMGMVDTLMVSRVGAEAISAVSLVDSINNLVLQVFAAMAAGAAIINSRSVLPSSSALYCTGAFRRRAARLGRVTQAARACGTVMPLST